MHNHQYKEVEEIKHLRNNIFCESSDSANVKRGTNLRRHVMVSPFCFRSCRYRSDTIFILILTVVLMILYLITSIIHPQTLKIRLRLPTGTNVSLGKENIICN